jgi:hypothetical protein
MPGLYQQAGKYLAKVRLTPQGGSGKIPLPEALYPSLRANLRVARLNPSVFERA